MLKKQWIEPSYRSATLTGTAYTAAIARGAPSWRNAPSAANDRLHVTILSTGPIELNLSVPPARNFRAPAIGRISAEPTDEEIVKVAAALFLLLLTALAFVPVLLLS